MQFSRQTTSLGRNGIVKTSGLDTGKFLDADNQPVIVLTPITSRGQLARCNIEVPPQDLPKLIAELQRFL